MRVLPGVVIDLPITTNMGVESVDSSAYLRSYIRKVGESLIRNSVVGPPDQVMRNLKNALYEQLEQILPATSSFRIVEEDEDMQLVRHIHEETNDTIQLEVTLGTPIRYLAIHINSDEIAK